MVLKLSHAAPGGPIPDSKRMCLNSMRMATIPIVITTIVLLWLPGTIACQVVPSPYRFLESSQEVGFFVGTSDPSPGQLRIGMGSATVYGGRYSLDMGSTLTLELGTTFFAGDREVLDPRRAEGDRQLGVSNLKVATVEARFRLNLTGLAVPHPPPRATLREPPHCRRRRRGSVAPAWVRLPRRETGASLRHSQLVGRAEPTGRPGSRASRLRLTHHRVRPEGRPGPRGPPPACGPKPRVSESLAPQCS